MADVCLILLIEDNDDDAYFFQRGLKKTSFQGQLRHVKDISEARDYINGQGPFAGREEHPLPSLIVADSAVSSRESGVEFLEWVRSHETIRETPFFLLTGGISDEVRKRAEEAGVQRIFLKTGIDSQIAPLLREILDALPSKCSG